MPAKEPQYKTDLAAVVKVAIGPAEYRFGSFGRDFAFSRKQQVIFQRVASRVNTVVTYGTLFATLRSKGVTAGKPIVSANTPRELAAALLSEYTDRGGPQ